MYYRVRDLKEEPYSQREAEAAAGLTWTDNGKRKEDDYELEMAEAT
jgi:bud site selection protein 20